MSQLLEDHHDQPPPTRPQFPLDANSYKLVAEIGAGVSAVVYRALCLPLNSAAVAIKSIDLDRSAALDAVRREAKIMSLLAHPNILNAHCSFTVGRRLWVVMPFMAGGSVSSVIAAAFPGGLPEAAIAPVLRDVLRAVAYLHAQGHLHRDIKAGNILLARDGAVKLADFGVSASLHDGSPITDVAGTPYWMAPEVIHSRNGYGTKADIWSFGITALELARGRPPLSHLPLSKSLVLKITKRFRFSDYEENGGENGTSKDGKKFSRAFKEMVGLCLNQDPSKRPTAEKLLKHSFFKNCKGLDFLVKNVLQGLPSVEERFRVFKSTVSSTIPDDHDENNVINNSDDDDDDDDKMKEKRRRISGWNFNENGFELDPVFPTESEDDSASEKAGFSGKTVVPEDGESFDSGELNPSSLSQTGELTLPSPSHPGQAGDESTNQEPRRGESDEPTTPSELTEASPNSPVQAGVPQDAATETLPSELGESVPSSPSQSGVDRERMVRDLLSLRRNIEAERTTVEEILRLIGAAEAEPEAEAVRSELEIERRRNSELEMEIEFLKMQLQRDD